MSNISSIKASVYQSTTDNIVKLRSGKSNAISMKTGNFLLNGKKIHIDAKENLETISKKINKHFHHTGVKAKIVKKANGYGLHLISNNKPVQILDKDGVLKGLYEKGHIGKSKEHLVRITGGNLFYNKPAPKVSSTSVFGSMLHAVKSHNPGINPNSLVVLNELTPLEDEVVQPPLEDEVVQPPLEDEVVQPPLENENNLVDEDSFHSIEDDSLDEVVQPPLENEDNSIGYYSENDSVDEESQDNLLAQLGNGVLGIAQGLINVTSNVINIGGSVLGFW